MQNVTLFRTLAAAGGVALAFSGIRPANAALTLTLSEAGFAPLTVTDTANTGALSYFGSYGLFSTDFVVGLSDKSTTPTPSAATLQFQTLDVTSMAAGSSTKTLSITLTDDGYTFPGPVGSSVQLDSAFGGSLTGATAGDSATFQSFVISPATTTGLQSYTAATTDSGTTSFSRNVTPVSFIRPASYTLQNVTTISLTAANSQANLSGTTVVSVPEPASVSAVVLLGLGSLRGRRRRH